MTEQQLRSKWPAAFNDERRPLALGIHANMGINYPDPAMFAWVTHPRYLRNLLVPGATRIDLEGQAAGVVTAEERERAWRALLEIRDQIYRARREKFMTPIRARWLPFSKADEDHEMRLSMPRFLKQE
jgi:sRNA-binding protein